MQSQEPIPKSILLVGKIHGYINCEDCGKCCFANSICYYCGECEDLVVVTPPQSLKERFKQVYPLCEGCQEDGKEFYTKGEIKTNIRSSKCHKT
ncbi:unnamed protein product [Rhizophagus irregularis]|nr:unnamed protein product [Rhizophagus irregularis]